MDTNIQTIYTSINEVTNVLQKMMSKNIETETFIKGLETKIKDLEKTIESERHMHADTREETFKYQCDLENKLDATKQKVVELEKENQKLFDESQSMRKVSQIIAFEKENGKLRKEIEAYRVRVEELLNLQSKSSMVVKTQENTVVDDTVDVKADEVKTQENTVVDDTVDDVKADESVKTQENTVVDDTVDDVKADEEVKTQENTVVDDTVDEVKTQENAVVDDTVDDVKTQENIVVEDTVDVKADEEVKTQEIAVVANSVVEVAQEVDKDSEDPDTEADISVFEKKIKGKLYYVSDDNIMNIFTILPDGGIGEQVGRYEKETESGKLKPMFH